jgi:zinc-ribbon domain
MPQTCPQCQSEAADDATFCASCGSSLSAASTGAPATGAPATGAPATGAPATGAPAAAAAASSGGASTVPAYKFDVARWTLADRIAGIATVVLFISLFLPWFTESFGFASGSVNGLWHGWMWITLILSIVIIAYLVLLAGWDKLPISQDVPHLTVMLVATIINAVLVLIAFIDKPGGSGVGWGFGAILGLIAALVAAAPYAVPQLRARTT